MSTAAFFILYLPRYIAREIKKWAKGVSVLLCGYLSFACLAFLPQSNTLLSYDFPLGKGTQDNDNWGELIYSNSTLTYSLQEKNKEEESAYIFTRLRPLSSLASSNKVPGRTTAIRVRADKRIGPHNKNILEILFGSLLGDGHAEYRSKGKGTRFTFYQEGSHVSYLLWLHDLLSESGYCSNRLPEIQTRLSVKGKVRKIIRFRTWTYTSFNWIRSLWYVNNIKVVPSNIGAFLTPIALAIWIMDDGSKSNQGLKLSTNSFTYIECIFLTKVLYENFNLKASVQSAGVANQYSIYIWKESMPKLREIVLPYVHSSMKYKLIV